MTIYEYLETNFNIKVTDYKFKRDYIKNPLRKWVDKSYKEDLEYLYITKNIKNTLTIQKI